MTMAAAATAPEKMTIASLIAIFAILSISAAAPLNEEVLGLTVFKSGLLDPALSLSSWNEDDPTPCAWAHVYCNPATSHVVAVSLDGLSLSLRPDRRRLPPGLDRLRGLRSLSLSTNKLSGEIPADLALLPRLRDLNLSRNAFSGPIPLALPPLRSLDISSNKISGTLPDSLFTNCTLKYLSLACNRLNGPLPATISTCRLIVSLNVSGNDLSGSIPPLPLYRLHSLDLSRNRFSGQLPDSLVQLGFLSTLMLSENEFSGEVPDWIGTLHRLLHLDLSMNKLTGNLPENLRLLSSILEVNLSSNEITGELGAWVSNLTYLRSLDASGNKLVGGIPPAICGLRGLKHLGLGGNLLTGSVPAEVMDLELETLDLSGNNLTGVISAGSARSLVTLDLSNNNLTGRIPPEMGLFLELRYINLSWNDLRARIPPEFGYFKNLSVVDLRRNDVYGEIPGEICDSDGLTVLQLDENSLTGQIPDAIGNCSALHLLSLSRNKLSGPIPVAISQLKKLEILSMEFNSLTGEIPMQLGTMESLVAVNVSHNRLVGRLPVTGVFPSLDQSALQGNLGLCTPLVQEPCRMNVPKPLVLDPYAYNNADESSNNDGRARALSHQPRRILSVSVLIAISAMLVIILGVMMVCFINVSARRRIGLMENARESMCSGSSRSWGASPAIGKVVLFSPKHKYLKTEDLVAGAEVLISKATEIGQGAFGMVYKASVREGRMIAIKKLMTSNIIQFHDEFDREVRVLGKARHPNLMAIKGYYWTPQQQLLFSDYCSNGSLQTRLQGSGKGPLSWGRRFEIAHGTARAIAYLHQSFQPPIIHYHIKPSNILLDDELNPMVSDFGLVRLLPKLDKRIMNTLFQGSMGYWAPEMACQSLRINEKCDVYSFGVLLLELVTGRRPVECGEQDVVIVMDEVRAMLEQGNALDCVDTTMEGFPEEEVLPVLKLGLVCASQIPSSRPSMAEVVQILQVIRSPAVERIEAI